jgi:hypothetical protein
MAGKYSPRAKYTPATLSNEETRIVLVVTEMLGSTNAARAASGLTVGQVTYRRTKFRSGLRRKRDEVVPTGRIIRDQVKKIRRRVKWLGK